MWCRYCSLFLLCSVAILVRTNAVKTHDECHTSTLTSNLVCAMCAPNVYSYIGLRIHLYVLVLRDKNKLTQALPVGLEQLLQA